MSVSTAKLLARIEGIQTLIENFPMNILDMLHGKKYTSVIELVLDVLHSLGYSEQELLDKVIDLFFEIPNAVEIYNGAGNYSYKKIKSPTDDQIASAHFVVEVPSTASAEDYYYVYTITEKENKQGEIEKVYSYYSKKAPLNSDDMNSKFLSNLEDSLKSIIANALVGILSCSVDPEIPDENMDSFRSGGKNYSGTALKFSKPVIDTFNLLSICPTNEIGKNFYNVEDSISTAELYKTGDLNAFIWYVLNRGMNQPQSEKNKMMWDSRRQAEKNGDETYIRNTPEQWNQWINSKTVADKQYFFLGGLEGIYSGCYANSLAKETDRADGKETIDLPLHPILQLGTTGGSTLTALFPSQTYYSLYRRNKSLYRFNSDYMNSIRILSPQVILTNMLEELLGGNITVSLEINDGWLMQIIEEKVQNALVKAMEVDDMTVSDCFYSFSNEDYEDMVRNYEMKKYKGVALNSDTSGALQISDNYGLDALNEINSMATSEGTVTTIKRTVYDVALLPSEDSSVSSTSIGANTQWIINIIMSMIKPIIRAIVSPQVMLLFAINFKIMGLINLEDGDIVSKVFNLVLKKIMAIVLELVEFIKDKIVEFLFNLFEEKVTPLATQCAALIATEQLEDWQIFLAEALACLPSFDFSSQRVLGQIDEVNYADIVKTQGIPESDTPTEC